MARLKLCLCVILGFINGDYCTSVTISAPVGQVKGSSVLLWFDGRSYRAMTFLGIPYAKPTDGNGRFAKPIKIEQFDETYDATKRKYACAQNRKWFSELESLQVGEDCLSLDIFIPHYNHVTKPKAVMIYVHGGGFQYGYKDMFRSEAFAAVNDVIYVTINYRLSAFGFLASKRLGLKGNYGLWDQHMAIQWIHENIAAFGGDPNRVTLFGESAGATSVMYQAMYEGNKGLIQRIIAESGSLGSYWTYSENPDDAFDDLIERSRCKMNKLTEILQCLRGMNVSSLQEVLSYETLFLPVTDGEFVKYNTFNLFKNTTKQSAKALRNFAGMDVIMGMNNDEGLADLEILVRLLGNNIEDLSDGMSAVEFENYIHRHMEYINVSDDILIIKSLIHQYTNWSNPYDPISRRSFFLDLLKDISYTPAVVEALNSHIKFDGQGRSYMYQFHHKPSFSLSPDWIKGANHEEELLFVLPGCKRFGEHQLTSDEILLSKNIMMFWTQFAKTGNPSDNNIKLGDWPEYTLENKSYIVLDINQTPLKTGSNFRSKYVNYWTNVFPWLQASVIAKDTCDVNTGSSLSSKLAFCHSLSRFYCSLMTMDLKLLILQAVLIFHVQGQFDPIAFTLGQDSHVNALDVDNATTIPFPVIILNHAQAQLNNGVFTCSLDGLYKFQVYSLTKTDSNLFLELYVNDKLVATLWAHTPGDYAAAGNAVVLALMNGDFVKVVTRSQYGINMYGTPDEIYTTFTGVQLGSLELNEEGSKLSAFSVSLTQHQDVASGNNILYNNILTDVNGAYDVTTGVYTAPTSGLYLFHFFGLARQNQELYQEFYHNNQYVCSIYGLTDQDWADAGNTVLLHLKQNDKVSIRAQGNNSIYGTSDEIYSTFSGVQLVTEKDMYSGQEAIIAFSVGLSQHATIQNNNKVMFDRVFIDLQRAYNPQTGEFVAPVSGLYEFNYHALGKQNGKIWLELFHNYKYVNSLYSHTPGHYATAGNAAVLELDIGDVVFIKAHNDVDLYGVNDEVYCTFTGYLLHPVSGGNEIIVEPVEAWSGYPVNVQ